MNGSLFNNDLMHNRTKKNNKYFIPVSIEATANHQTLLLHQRLHEMKTVQTFLNEEQNTETASPSKSSSSKDAKDDTKKNYRERSNIKAPVSVH